MYYRIDWIWLLRRFYQMDIYTAFTKQKVYMMCCAGLSFVYVVHTHNKALTSLDTSTTEDILYRVTSCASPLQAPRVKLLYLPTHMHLA